MKDTSARMIRGARDGSVTITGNREWRLWVQELAKAERTSVAGLLDRLAAEHAKKVDFRSPPIRASR